MKTIKIYHFTVLTLAVLTVAAQSPRLRYSIQPDVATAVYTNNFFSVAGQDISPKGVRFSSDGLRLFYLGGSADQFYQYDLTTAHDITSATFDNDGSNVFGISGQTTEPRGFTLSPDGSKLFLVGSDGSDLLFEYDLSTSFDIGTATYNSVSFDVTSQTTGPHAVRFNPAGTKMFILGFSEQAIFQYSLSTAFDISTASYDNISMDIGAQEASPTDINLSEDGKRLYTIGISGDAVDAYSLGTAFDLASPTYLNTFSVSSQGGSPQGFTMDELGTTMIVVQDADIIYEYALEDIAFEETLANTGILDGVLTVSIIEDDFVNAGSTLNSPTHFSIANAPAGLTPTLTVDGSGSYANLTFADNATANDVANDLDELQFTFTDAAFENSTAAQVTNASQDVSVEINFRPGEAVSIPKTVSYAVEPDITTMAFTNSVFVVNDQDSNPRCIAFNHDGTRLFMMGHTNDRVYQYDLTTPYDITTASFGTSEFNQFSFANENVEPRGITFQPDGTRMYMIANSSEDRIYQYDLASPFDVSSATYSGISLNVFTQDEFPQSLRFNVDGTKLYMIGSATDAIYQYALSTPYDISSAAYDNVSMDLSATDTAPTDLEFSSDGTRLYVAGTTNDRIFAFDLNGSYDISSSTALGSFLVSSQTSFPAGLAFDNTGSVLLVLGNSSSSSFDRVNEYSLENIAFEESLANTGALEGTLTISIDSETFANAGGTLTSPEHFSIANSPSGLTPTIAVDASGSFANLIFNGNATANDVANDLDELQFSFTDDAFQTATAAEVSNATKDIAVEVNFRPSEAITIPKSLSYTIEPDITTATFSNNVFVVSDQDTDPRGMAFNHDGSRMYMVGRTSDQVYQYDLGTPYDITSASFGTAAFNQFSLSDENDEPRGITFRPDGTQMYITASSTDDRVYQYDLASPFDVSSASYNGVSFNVFSQDDDPQAIRFNTDGTKMFLIGNSSDAIHQYSLSTPYDVGSASFDDVSMDLSTTDTTPVDLEFSADGTRLFISGTTNDRIFAFDLNGSYDISSSIALGSFLVSAQSSFPAGLVFDNTATVMYVLGSSSSSSFDRVNEYNLENTAFEESLANTGVLEGTLTISIDSETFTNSGGTLTSPEHFSIANSPEGLTPSLSVDASGAFANLVFTGNATSNDVANDLDILEFSFTDDAFQSSIAAEVNNATKDVGVEVNFRPSEAISIDKSLSYSVLPDITTGVYGGINFNVNDQDATPQGFTFNHDGTRFFYVGDVTNTIYQYDLSTPYDLTTASFGTEAFNSLSVGDLTNEPWGVDFNPEGTKMYLTTNDDRVIYQYNLASPYDISSATYANVSLDVSPDDVNPIATKFNLDGTKVYILDWNVDALYEYDLSEAYNIGSGTITSNSLGLSANETGTADFVFSKDGRVLYVVGVSGDAVDFYNLDAPFEIASGQYGGTLVISSQAAFPVGIQFNNSGTRMFIINDSSSDLIFEYQLDDVAFEESLANTGILEGTLTISIESETFVNTGGTLTSPEHFSIANTPAGLTPSLSVDGSGRIANLQFNGNATSNDVTNDLNELQFTFTDDAFQTATASEVSNSNKDVAVEVNFRPSEASTTLGLSYHQTITLDAGFYANRLLDVNDEDVTSRSMAFNQDGSRLFYMGAGTDRVYQYNLSVPFDLSTAVYGAAEFNSFYYGSQTSDAWGLAFHPDGTAMYITGLDNDAVYQYDLAAPFDVSSATYDGILLNVVAQDNVPLNIRFNTDGSKMYMLGSQNDAIYAYALSEPFDITTAVYSDTSLDISAEETSSTDFVFSANGSQLFITGVNGDAVDAYDLSTAFDISTAALASTFSVSARAGFPTSIAFNNHGSRLFVMNDGSPDVIFEYALDSVAFSETLANTGILQGDLEVRIVGDTLSNARGTLTSPEHFTITNLPEGMTATLIVDSEGISAELQLSGSASSNDVSNNLDTLNFEFTDGAFVNSVASDVGNSSSNVGLQITFRPGKAQEPLSLKYTAPVTLSGAFYNERLLDVDELDVNSRSIAFNHDGSKLYYLGDASQRLYQYDLTSPYDVTSATFGGLQFNSFDYSAQTDNPYGLSIHPEGDRMYITSTDDARVFQYDLASPFDIGSAVYNNVFYQFNNLVNPRNVHFDPTGMEMYVMENSSSEDKIIKFTLASAFDVSTAEATSEELDISTIEIGASDFIFTVDGKYLLTSGTSNDAIDIYALPVAYDIANGQFQSRFSISSISGFPTGLALNGSGTRLYVSNDGNPDVIFEFALNETAFEETSSNIGALSGDLEVRFLGDTFVNSGGVLTSPEHFSITNAPEGLTPQLNVSDDGTLGYLEFLGTTSANDSANNLDTLSFVFTDAAFTSSSASEVVNSSKDVSLGIEFRPGSARVLSPGLIYSPEININTLSYSGNAINVGDQEVDPDLVYFTPEGDVMFILGFGSDAVYQYDLSSPFDVTTATFGRTEFNSFSVASELNGPTGLEFNKTGTKMYVADFETSRIYEYNLTAPFDVSSASYSGTFLDVSTEDSSANGIRWDDFGTRLFVLGAANEFVYSYTLTESYNLGTATYDEKSIAVGAQEAEPRGIELDKSGTQLLVIGWSGDDIDRYEMSTPFDLNSAVYTGSISVSNQTSGPRDIFINEAGDRLYTVTSFSNSTSSDFIHQFSLSASANFTESELNNGELTGSAFVNLVNDTFINANGVLTSPEHFTITNAPAGLTPRLNVDPTGTLATLEFLGNATANDITNNLDTLRFTFTDAAFTNSAASEVTNSTAEVPIGIDFLQNPDLDLVITELNANSPVLINSPITISYQLTNEGTEAVGASTTSIYLSDDNQFDAEDELLTSRTEEALDGGAVSFVTDLQISEGLTADSYTVFIFLDAGGEILESNEVNNLTSFTLDVVPNLPNLNPFDLTHPDEANQGDEITVTYSVRNLGIAVAGTSTTRVFLSEDETVDPTQDVLLGSVTEAEIQPQSTTPREIELTIPLETDPGTYTVILALDALDEVEEVSENDNHLSFTLEVIKRPTADLLVEFISGQAIDSLSTTTPLQYVISNTGNAASPVTTTAFYLSTDSLLSEATDVLITTKSEGVIEAGEELSVNHEITLPSNADPGTYQILILVDSENTIPEVDETNNLTVFRLELRLPGLPPDITGVATSASTFELGRGSTMELSFQVTDRNGDLSNVELRYASGSVNFDGEEVNIEMLTSTGDNRYTYTFEESDFDNLGLQYQIIATDAAGLSASTAVRLIPVSFTDAIVNEFVAEAVENVGVGEEQVDYEMISIPFQNFTVDDLGMGPQTQSTTSGNVTTVTELWAVAGWNGSGFTDLSAQSQMLPGVGYWVLSSEAPSISFDEKNTVNAQFFELDLPQTVGFNLIGNPYLFDLDWATIVDYNITIGNLSAGQVDDQVYIYTNGGYDQTTTLSRFQGAFLQSSGAGDLVIPSFAVVGNSSGRSGKSSGRTQYSNEWTLPLHLSTPSVYNKVGAIGMREGASIDHDQYDLPRLPRFSKFIDLNNRNAGEAVLSRDIVPFAATYLWELTVEKSPDAGESTLEWSTELASQIEQGLYLVVPDMNLILDMKEKSSLTLKDQTSLEVQIVKGALEEAYELIDRALSSISTVYPNPTSGQLQVEVRLTGVQTPQKVELLLTSLDGRVNTLQFEELLSSGVHSLQLDLTPFSSGIYLLQMRFNNKLVKGTLKVLKTD